MSEDCELLFFDTFSHDSCEELNLDLVQFPRTVYIYEIRVIPLGARVQADFPGGFRLGATNPSSFKLEFFVNDLSKRNACTFERLGSLEYKQNVDIQFAVSNKIPTDGLVLRGWYNAVTLAVYGVLTKTVKERTSPPPPPPPQPTPRPQQNAGKEFECPVGDPNMGVEWDHQPRVIEAAPEPPLPPVRCHAPPPPPPPPVVEAPRFAEVPPPMVLPPAESLPQYTTDVPQPVFTEPVTMPYPEHLPPPVSAVPPPVPYTQYEVPQYTKQWTPGPEDQFQPDSDGYNRQVYNRPPDAFKPNVAVSHAGWDNKESCMPSEMAAIGQDPNPYNPQNLHDIKPHPRDKDSLQKDRDRDRDRNRDRPWERDGHSSDYKDEDNMRRDSKRKERDHRSRETSWERGSVDSDRYRDRDRDRDKERDRPKDLANMRERERDKDRGRERSREKTHGRDVYGDRGSRMSPRDPPKEVREPLLGKRPATPPSPQKNSAGPRTPQTPPDVERPVTGPRTPKEDEPGEAFEERNEESAPTEEFFSLSPDHMTGEQLYNLSEGEIQDGENTEEDDGYEEIVSEEEDMSDVETRVIDMTEMDYDLGDETWNYMSSFSPYQCDLTSLQHFDDPTLTALEVIEKKGAKGSKEKPKEDAEETNKLACVIDLISDKEHNEKWVEALESLSMSTITEGLTSQSSPANYEATVSTLIGWVVEGLDFEAALKQPQTAYKVRHLKAGIRLASFLFQTKSAIVRKLLNLEIPKKLLELFEQPYMALPVKLLILRALDAATHTKAGLDFILCKNVQFQPPKDFGNSDRSSQNHTGEPKCTSGYQKLLDFLMTKQLTRAVVSITALLNKIHLYEVILQLRDSVEKMVVSTQTTEPKVVNEESLDQAPSAQELESDQAESPQSSSSASEETLTQIIIGCVREITSIYANTEKTVAQPLRYLPARTQYEVPQSPFEPYPGLLRMFKENQLLESIFVMLSSPALAGHIGMLSAVRDLFMEFLRSQKGMAFLLTSSDTINGIHRALLQTLDEAREEGNDENIAQNLAMQIAYHLQALLYVDCLFSYQARGGPKLELDDSEVVSALHHMYTMIFSPIGRQAVVTILSMEQNINCLLPFVVMTGEEEFDTKLAKSVCTGYVTELIMLTVHYSESINLLENFSETLFNLSQQDVTPKLHDLNLWMSPARRIPSYTHEAISPLVAILKDQVEDAASLPPELITTVRILQHITLSQGNSEGLKYMYSIVQLVTNDGLASFLTILQRISETFLKPSHQSAALVGLQGVLVVALVKPIICIMKSILGYLISCRDTEFKDLTSVPVLLQVFSVMTLIPSSSYSCTLAQTVQAEIIETLLTFTQPCLGSSESEEALSKSLWTQMIREVLKYIRLSPSTFMVGLTVFSELLPLPLPLQTKEPLSTEEVNKVVNNRKLWSAHLHSLSAAIQEVIINLAASSCHPLQQLLRRVCIQLADLAAPTALVVVRSVLDALLDSLASICPLEQKEDAPPALLPTPLMPCSSWSARLLNLVAYLVSHAAFKIPLMHILRGSVKADEKYVDVLQLLLKQLNVVSVKPAHIQSQECIVSILQSLCDPDIGFITFESGASVQDVLSSCLPAKDHMLQICSALIQHIGNPQHNYASILPSLRSLVMLTEHDYGFYHVKQGLEQHPRALFSLFSRLSSSFSKDSSDCLSTLSTTLEFLRLLVNGYEDGAQTGRTLLLTPAELSSLLSGRSDFGKEKQEKSEEHPITFLPLMELESFLTECANDEEAVESLLESVSGLIQLLNEVVGKDEKVDKDVSEPMLPPPETQSVQFASRPVFVVGEVEEGRLSPAYWLSIPGAEDADQEQEQVSTDLVDLSEHCISNEEFDLKNELEKLCSLTDAEGDAKGKKSGLTIGKRKYQPLVNPATAEVTSKKPFIAPMRGRGFSRASAHSSRANDPFRSRPPNTSRPPSMHVDDFVALESHQTSNNPQAAAKRPQKENTRGRGRGFERGQAFASTRGGGGGGGGGSGGGSSGGGGGRFFSPPGPYSRRDTVRGGGGRGTSRLSNNAWGNRINSNTIQKPPTGAGNRTNFGGRGRCNYSFPFNQNEPRPVGQRNRDPYAPEGGPPLGAIPVGGRFIRGVRTGGPNQQSMQGQWQDNRNKQQGGRFMPANPAGRGGIGRRDLNIRHARAFTR